MLTDNNLDTGRIIRTQFNECQKLRAERDTLLALVKEAWVALYTLDIRLDNRRDLWTTDERRIVQKLDDARHAGVSS